MFITVSEDNSVVLWEIDSEEQAELQPTKQFKLDSDGYDVHYKYECIHVHVYTYM